MMIALIICGTLGSPLAASGQMIDQRPQSPTQIPQTNRFPVITAEPFPKPSQKQKQALADYNFRQMKKHVKDLSAVVKSLQKEIAKSNENILSLAIVKKAQQVQKLAKKIEREAKGD